MAQDYILAPTYICICVHILGGKLLSLADYRSSHWIYRRGVFAKDKQDRYGNDLFNRLFGIIFALRDLANYSSCLWLLHRFAPDNFKESTSNSYSGKNRPNFFIGWLLYAVIQMEWIIMTENTIKYVKT